MTQATQNALALCGVKETPNDITKTLDQAAREGFPVVAPGGTTQCAGIAPGHSAIVTAVTPSEEDVYIEQSSKARCYKATFLKKLAAGLGRPRTQPHPRVPNRIVRLVAILIEQRSRLSRAHADETGRYALAVSRRLLVDRIKPARRCRVHCGELLVRRSLRRRRLQRSE